MATRSFQFFMRPPEFATLLWHAVEKHRLSLVVAAVGVGRRVEVASKPESLELADGTPARWAFLAAETPDLHAVDPQVVRPAEWGWVDCEIPREEGAQLFLGRVAAKSDWYDPVAHETRENPTSLGLFKKVAPLFRVKLQRPVWGHNLRTGGAACYRDIGYSNGATEWVKGGGELRQEGSANVVFLIEQPRVP